MATPWENSFHKIARIEDLPIGQLQVYRAAGTTVVLRRDDFGVSAIDGSEFIDDGALDPRERLRKIVDGVGGQNSAENWYELVSKSELLVKVDNGDVWVCIEGCRP
jgi:hypothetical protein